MLAKRLLRGKNGEIISRQLHVENKIHFLGLSLPPPCKDIAHPSDYDPIVKNYLLLNDRTVYLSRHIHRSPEGLLILAKVGRELDTDEGYAAAKLCGNLDAVKRVVKLTGFLNCVDGYTEQPRVMDGASEGIWTPQRCPHTRSAISVNALPSNAPLEIEAIFEIESKSLCMYWI